MQNYINKKFPVGLNNISNREAWLSKTLDALPAGLNLLDAGAGELNNKKYCKHLNYTSQDFCEYDGSGDNKALQTGNFDTTKIDVISDITNMPLADQSFDVVLCTEVLEHVPDPVKAINEMNRVLKRDGYLIITAPFCSLTHFSPYHFATGFNIYFYKEHLSAYDFVDMNYNGNYYEYLAQEIRRLNQISQIYNGKKISFFHKILNQIQLFYLDGLSKKNNNSEELLSFGINIIAKKL